MYSQESDRTQWQLTRRFFLIDKIGGVEYTSKSKMSDAPSIIRYVQACTLRYATLTVFCFDPMQTGCVYVNCTDLAQYKINLAARNLEFLELLKEDCVP
jgi:hypothetical protein